MVMMISYTYRPPTGCEQEVKDDLVNFLLDIPSLFFLNYVPPIAVLNDVLASGGRDAGMSGGCKWQPFALDETDYVAVINRLKTMADRPLVFVESPTDIQSFNQWMPWVMHHKLGVPLAEYSELLAKEMGLEQQRDLAYQAGDHELGDELHCLWIEATENTMEFLQPYLKIRRGL